MIGISIDLPLSMPYLSERVRPVVLVLIVLLVLVLVLAQYKITMSC